MAHEAIDIDWAEELRHQSVITGRLVSGHRFSGKVYACGKDYIQIVELKIEDSNGTLVRESNLDIVRMLMSAIMYFDKN